METKTTYKSDKNWMPAFIIIYCSGEAMHLYAIPTEGQEKKYVGMIKKESHKGWRYTDLFHNESFLSRAGWTEIATE